MKATQQDQTAPELANIVEYLKENPNIFVQHPELLESLTLSDSRGTASLLERQVAALKERLNNLKSEQSELIEVARENEQISDSFTEIIFRLIAYENLSELVSDFPLALRKTFNIDEVSLKTAPSAELIASDRESYDEAVRRLVNQRAVCDNRWPSSIMKLFFSESVTSAALVPMCTPDSDVPLGILALGSNDAKRYANELGTDYLNRLGLMSGICLARLQPNNT